MSAAQPADPAHPYTGPDDAAVIPLNQRHRRGTGRTARGRWSHMRDTPPGDTPPQPADKVETRDGHDDEPSALAAFASSIETSFLEIGQSLTTPDTAAAFQRTLDIWERALQGSHAQGIIDAGQLDELTTILKGMREAPKLL
ncbi:hypothetical protein [Streptomyces sp. NPDC004783]|uniref:hypothetical protein n=1 Tax=Streptomyces sp. NPDC004783 TaxID=3154459 RepID=UPI0033AF1B15